MSKSRNVSLLFAGLVAAAGTVYLFETSDHAAAYSKLENKEALRALAQAKKRMKKGDWPRAIDLLASHSTSENPRVLLEHAKILSRGWGVRRDLDKARDKLLLAVQHDFSKRGEAAFELAKVYRHSSGEDCARLAFEWFTKAVQWGFEKAHGELGRHHAKGIGVPVDYRSALHHYQIAASFGSANSLLSFIKQIKRSPDLAVGLPDVGTLIAKVLPQLEREANGGRGSSAKILGRLYRDGLYVEASTTKALTWLSLGADLGDTGAMCDWALLTLSTSPSASQIKQALGVLRKAAELNNAGANTELGRLHLEEVFGLKAPDSIDYFERGISLSHAGSMLEMARLHLEGRYVSKDKSAAKKLAKRGAARGHRGSRKLLEQITGKPKLRVKAQPKQTVSHTLGTPQIIRIAPAELNALTLQNEQKRNSETSVLTGATVITRFGRKN